MTALKTLNGQSDEMKFGRKRYHWIGLTVKNQPEFNKEV
jgi:hypothetical protein